MKNFVFPQIGEHRFVLRGGTSKWYRLRVVEIAVEEIATIQTKYGERHEVYCSDANGWEHTHINAEQFDSVTYKTEEEANEALKTALRQMAKEEISRAEKVMEGL